MSKNTRRKRPRRNERPVPPCPPADLECALLSESALAEWNSKEEDAAWAHLQREP